MAHVNSTLAREDSKPSRHRGDLFLVVVFASLLVVTACSQGTDREPDDRLPVQPVPSTTTAVPADADLVVVDFYKKWNAGDIESAVAIAAEDVRSSWGTGELLSSRMAFTHALGHTRHPSECVVAANGPSSIVTCTVSVEGAVADEIEIEAPRERHLVTNRRIVNLTFSPAYVPAEQALAAAAAQSDPAGFEQACGAMTADTPLTHTSRCGTFLAGFGTEAGALLPGFLPAEADPLEVVAGFYKAWNAGNVDEAINFLSPDVVSQVGSEPGIGFHRLRNFMDFAVALPLSVDAESCEQLGSATSPAIVSCFVEYESELFDAMDIAGARVPHKVANGVLVAVNIGAQYAIAEKALADFIRSTEPDAFEAACADPDKGAGLTYSEFGFTYNATCGAFAARFLDRAVEAMSTG